ncbi:MAG: topoisomerase C-terminal repeat-containing protein, partial [Firmicutes bacterium]|nr:topoisomerase C-terminal repeat-containing protein [Bacillota bacterium]
VARQKNHLVPTQKAMILMDRLPVEDLKSPELTAHWETILDKIAKGESNADDFIKDVQDKSRSWCQQFYGSKIHLDKNESGMIDVAVSAKKASKFPEEAYGHKFTETEKENLSKGDTYYFSKLVTKNGTKFSAWVQYINNELKYFKYNPFLTEAAVCPRCHSAMHETSTGIACPKGCTVIPHEVLGKRLSIQDKYDLLTAGKTDVIRGFTSRKTGNLFDGRLMLDENFRVVFKFSSEAKPPIFHVRPSLVGKKYYEVWEK